MKFALALGIGLLLALPTAGHEARPLHVEILEESPGDFLLRWRTPGSVAEYNRPDLELPACESRSPDRRTRSTQERRVRCPESPGRLRILYPVFNPSVTTLVRFARASGETHTVVLGPGEDDWRIPPPETRGRVAREYVALGIAHIARGADHLLFVACLLFVAGTWRRILWTVTGFTLAHSLTLALSALGIVRVPVPPVEAAIALSIVFLASEIARGPGSGLAWQRPILVSSSFGLLHGFGFATVLREIGLPQTELPAALLFFNVGVEIGQLLFIGALLAVWSPVHRALARLGGLATETILQRARVPVAYGVGWLASYWLIDRVAGFF